MLGLKRSLRFSRAISEAVKLFGKSCFSVEVLAWAAFKEELSVMERWAVEVFREQFGTERLYNVSAGGYDGGFLGGHHTEDARKRIGAAAKGNKYCTGMTNHLGHKHSPAARAKIRAARAKQDPRSLSHEVSLEQRIAISCRNRGSIPPNKGRSPTEKTRAKMRAAHLGVLKSEAQRQSIESWQIRRMAERAFRFLDQPLTLSDLYEMKHGHVRKRWTAERHALHKKQLASRVRDPKTGAFI